MLEHGGRLRKAAMQYGIPEADWLDLSSGLAPWPFPIPEIPLRAWARLPENDDGLEQAACEYYGTPHVLPVAGSQAAIQLLPRLRRAGKVGVLSPCYAEHAEAWRRAGYIVREVLEQEVDFFLDSLDVLVVVNPNNPTGLSLTPQRLLDWHARLAQRGGWLVVDEAFMDITPQLSLAGQAHQRKLLKLLAEQVGPWAVSGPTRVLGQVCLRDTAGHAQQRLRCESASQRLFDVLERHDLRPQGGCALFQWMITDRAEQLHEFMAQRGILLRLFVDNSSLRFGLPDTEADWLRLEQALKAYKEAS
eukprot:gene20483-24332_t